MIRITTMLWLVIATTLGAGLFYLKYDVQELERALIRLDSDIASDERAIHVLEGEWSYLNQPSRLGDLSRRHLDLRPLTRDRIVTLTDLPPRFDAGAAQAGPARMAGGSDAR